MGARKNQQGVAALEALLIVVILAIIGLIGFKVMGARHSVDQISNQTDSSQQTTPQALRPSSDLPSLNTASDLNKAQQSLNAENPDDNSGDLSQIDSQLASF
jgi:Tfp pilus assembly protein FimT